MSEIGNYIAVPWTFPARAFEPKASDAPEPLRDLSAAMAAGNEEAYRTFYVRFGGRLHRYLLVLLRGDEHAAKEILQLSLLRLTRHVRVFEDEAIFWSWLTTLARSALIDESRKRRRYSACLERFRAELPRAEPQFSDSSWRERLGTHLEALQADERIIIERKYFARESVRAVADSLGLTEKALEGRLTRARGKLRKALLADINHA